MPKCFLTSVHMWGYVYICIHTHTHTHMHEGMHTNSTSNNTMFQFYIMKILLHSYLLHPEYEYVYIYDLYEGVLLISVLQYMKAKLNINSHKLATMSDFFTCLLWLEHIFKCVFLCLESRTSSIEISFHSTFYMLWIQMLLYFLSFIDSVLSQHIHEE